MKEMQSKNEINELNQALNAELSKSVNQDETKEEFQGFEMKEPEAAKKPKKRKNGKPKLTKKQIFLRILMAIGILIVVLVAGFFIARAFGKSSMFGGKNNMEKSVDGADVSEKGKTIVYKGHKYCYNEDVTSILFMGIDKTSIDSNEESLKKNGAGQSDFLFLAVIDTNTRKISLLNISRDIVSKLKLFDKNGKVKTTEEQQICLAYAYGDGKEISCKNTVTAVQDLLYGVPIDSYMSLNLSAIGILNDAIGGVNVQVLEDLTSVDPDFVQGTNVTLVGDQAEEYVRSRQHDPLDANNARMARQQQYINAFAQKAIQQTKSDIMLPVDLLNQISSNSVTNLSATKITYLSSLLVGGGVSMDDITSIGGTIDEGSDGYAECHVDETSLFETVLKVFYKQVS